MDDQIRGGSYGRLFAGVYMGTQQRKVTAGDLIMLNYDMGLDIGQEIVLDKVRKTFKYITESERDLISFFNPSFAFQIMFVGGSDFTLLGRPILPRDLVRVDAVVVEKNLDRTRVTFRGKRLSRGITHHK